MRLVVSRLSVILFEYLPFEWVEIQIQENELHHENMDL